MSHTPWLWNLTLAGIGGLALAVFGLRLATPVYVQAQPAGDQAASAKYLGAGQCINCHTAGRTGNRTEDFVLLTEFATWRTQDRHSLAYIALLGPRGKQM